MAYKFSVSDIIDTKVVDELQKVSDAFLLAKNNYSDMAKELAKEIKVKVDTTSMQAAVEKGNKYAEMEQKLAAIEKEMIAQQEKYKQSLAHVSEQLKENTKAITEEARANKLNAEAALTVEKANTEKLRQSKLLNQQSKTTVTTEEQITKALNMQVTSIAQAREQNKILTKARNEVVLSDEKAIKKLTEFNAKLDQNNAYIKKNSDSLTRQKMDIGGYSDAIQNAFSKMGIGGNTVNKLLESFKNLGDGANKSSEGIGKASGALSKFKVGALAVVAVIAVVAAAFVKLGKTVIEVVTPFEYSVSKLAAILQTTSNNITELSDNARALGAVTKYTATEVVGLQTELAKLGFNKQEILETAQAVLFFAQAVGTDLSSAAALTGSTLRSFGATTQETERYVSSMAIATTKSALDFSKLQTAMPIVGAAAKAMGFEIEDTVSLLGVLANAGLEASSSATALRNIFLNLANTSGDLSKAMGGSVRSLDEFVAGLDRIKKSGADLGEVLQLTDKRSVIAFQNLLNNKDVLKELRGSVTDVAQAMYTMAEVMEDNLQGSTSRLSSAWEEFLITLDNIIPFSKIKRGFTDMLTSMLMGINSLSNSLRTINDEYDNQFNKVSVLQTSTEKLADRYDELKGKAELNAAEQKELDDIMQQLTLSIPGVATEFDKYGKVLSINTDAARKFVDIQIVMLEYQNADAIKATNKELENARDRYERLSKAIGGVTQNLKAWEDRPNETYVGYANMVEYLRKKVIELTKSLFDTGAEVQNLELRLQGLTGATIKEQLQIDAFNKKTIAQLDEWIEKNKEATDSIVQGYVKMAAGIRESKVEELIAELTQKGMKETRAWLDDVKNANSEYRSIMQSHLKEMEAQPRIISEKELKEMERYAAERLKIRQTLQQSEIDLMDEGLNKMLARIRLDFNKKIEAIKGTSAEEVQTRINLEEQMNRELGRVSADYAAQAERRNVENRIEAVEKGTKEELDLRIRLLELQYYQEVEAAEKTGEDVFIIYDKYEKRKQALQEDAASLRLKKLQEEAADEAVLRDSALLDEQVELSKQLASGEINRKEYEKRKYEIIKEYAVKSAEAAIEALQDQLDAEGAMLSADDRIALEKKIADAKINLSNLTKKHTIKAGEDTAKSVEEQMKQIADSIRMVGQALSAMTDLASALYDRQISKVEEQQDANQAAHDEEIARIERLAEIGAISSEEAEARKRAAEDVTAAKEAELAKKKAELQTRQAKLEKASNIAQIILNTSVAIMKSWGQLGIFGAPMAAIIGAIGAIQLATAIATPIPKYAKGTENHPGGVALVGDAGKSELVKYPTGELFITPNNPILVDLPKGAKVFPDVNKLDRDLLLSGMKSMMKNNNNDGDIIINNDFNALENKMDLMNKSFKNMAKNINRSNRSNDIMNMRYMIKYHGKI